MTPVPWWRPSRQCRSTRVRPARTARSPRCWRAAGDFAAASRHAEAAAGIDPRDPSALYNRGLIRWNLGDRRAARGDFDSAAALLGIEQAAVVAATAGGVSVGFERVDGYLPIAAYGLIGDCRSAALVGADGSVDWLCLPRFDNPSIFGRIIDARRGGHWQVCPVDEYRVQQRYRDRSNILETLFSTAGGTALVTDFMPIDEDSSTRHALLHRDPRLIRIVECLTGSVTLRHQFKPAPEYGQGASRFVAEGWRLHGDTAALHLCLQSSVELTSATVRWRMKAGDVIGLALRSDHRGRCQSPHRPWNVEHARALARSTQEFWWRWIDRCTYRGPYRYPVVRAALCLKLMTYTPTGAIVAAPTTSLPEQIGGPRNWDYRFTWLRDASLTLYAFFQVGMVDEANAFFAWLVTHRPRPRRSRRRQPLHARRR